jgi:hypothetical protein
MLRRAFVEIVDVSSTRGGGFARLGSISPDTSRDVGPELNPAEKMHHG